MKYTTISADSHIDMTWLPGDLFTSNVSSQWKEVVPKVVETKEGFRWVAEGKELGVVGGMGHGFAEPKRGLSLRTDKMIDVGFYKDGSLGKPHPTTPELRLKDMEMDQIDAEVIYGILATGLRLDNKDLVTVVYQVYNNWISEFCNSYPGRWAGLACIPNHDPEQAAKEVYRASALGLKGADFDVVTASKDLWDMDWEPLWHALEECKMPVSFHVTGPRGYPLREDLSNDSREGLIFIGIRLTLFQSCAAEFLASIILSGALDRHPGLNFVLGEAGAGWLPYTLERMDLEYDDRLQGLNLSMKPSEFWYRQGYTTFQTETTGPKTLDMIGYDNVMWGSDYPHPDGVWPGSQDAISNDMGHLSEDVRDKLIRGNAAHLYGFSS